MQESVSSLDLALMAAGTPPIGCKCELVAEDKLGCKSDLKSGQTYDPQI